ncbi:MAG: hypothetical protein IJY62_00090 [Clostridia bacterium]|nr:hypothetical protein [Clostridia bacterium]
MKAKRRSILGLFLAFCLFVFGGIAFSLSSVEANAATYTYTFDGTEDYSSMEMSGNWAVNGGVLERKSGGGDGFVWFNNFSEGDAVFSFKLKFVGQEEGANGDYAISLISKNDNKGNWQSSNRVIMRTPNWNIASSGNFVECYSNRGSVIGGTPFGGFAGFVEGTVYTVNAVFCGDRVQVAVDGVVYLDAVIPNVAAGNVGINSWRAYCEIDDLTLRTATAADFVEVPSISYNFSGEEDLRYLNMNEANGFAVADGALKRTSGGGDGRVYFNQAPWKNAVLEFDVKLTAKMDGVNNYAFSVITRSAATDGGTWQNSVRFILTAPDSEYRINGKAVGVESGIGGVSSPEGNHSGLVLGETYTVKVVTYESYGLLYLNNELLVNATIPGAGSGRIGFNSWCVACEVDNVSLKQATKSDLPAGFFAADENFYDFGEGCDTGSLSMDNGWAVNNGVLERKSGGGDGFVWLNNSSDWTNVYFDFDYKITDTCAENMDYNLSVVTDNGNVGNWQSSSWAVLRATDWRDQHNFVECYSGNGAVSNNVATEFTGFVVGETYHITVVNYGANLAVLIDGTLVMNATVMEGCGRVGLNSWQQYCEVDNLTISKATASDYAKATLLKSYAQVNAEGTALRFVSTIDSLNYKGAGFVITINGVSKNVSVSTVYTSIKAGDSVLNATDVNAAAQYVFVYSIWDIPADQKDTEITVRAYWVEEDGTVVYGQSRVFTVNGVQFAS